MCTNLLQGDIHKNMFRICYLRIHAMIQMEIQYTGDDVMMEQQLWCSASAE